jgi:hypothetical protein
MVKQRKLKYRTKTKAAINDCGKKLQNQTKELAKHINKINYVLVVYIINLINRLVMLQQITDYLG